MKRIFVLVALLAACGGNNGTNNGSNNGSNGGSNNGTNNGTVTNNGTAGPTNNGGTDADGDGVADADDNCADEANEDQADGDSDGFGDACDNCVQTANEDQADLDGDSFGDVCDSCIPGGDVNYSDIYFEEVTENDQVVIEDLAAGDIDGDGITDIAVLGFLEGDRVAFYRSVLEPDGDAEFFTRYDTEQPGSGPTSIVGLDANGDGFFEFATANAVDITVVQNRAEGNRRDLYFDVEHVYAASGLPVKIRAGDVDADGDTDLLVLAGAPNRLAVFFNDGDGVFGEEVSVPLAGLETATLLDFDAADLDQTAGIDAAILADTNQVAVLTAIKANGAATMTTFEAASDLQEFQRIAAGSIQQNGIFDLAFVAPRAPDADPEFAVYANDGEAGFTEYYTEILGIDPTTLLFADITFDGFADVYVGPYFWAHSETDATYGGGRVRLTHQARPHEAMLVNVTDDSVGELIIAEDLRVAVLTPSCD